MINGSRNFQLKIEKLNWTFFC